MEVVLGFFFTLILGSYGFTFTVMRMIGQLKDYVYKLPCATTDVEKEIEDIKVEIEKLKAARPANAIGFITKEK